MRCEAANTLALHSEKIQLKKLNVPRPNTAEKETKMTYTKPAVVILADPIAAIRGSAEKCGSAHDATSSLATTPAYEADE
jgi:hypothetical protein